MGALFLIVFFVILYFSVIARLIVRHPFATVFYAIKDTFYYFVHKEYNYYQAGKLRCYTAEFGGGKTLSIVHLVVLIFERFNNIPVWDRERKRFVTQKIHIISNVEFKTIPYEPLVSLSQFVCCGYRNKKIDVENNTRTVVLCIIDEASSQLNSRNFKTNIDPLFLNTLITSRHYHISLFYSSQEFKLSDALLRTVTQVCIDCKKIWRFVVQSEYSAKEMEYASDPTMIKPKKRTGFFVLDKDYDAYDTLATVDNLKKSVDENDMMSEEEILQLRGELNPNNDAVSHRSRKLKRRKK